MASESFLKTFVAHALCGVQPGSLRARIEGSIWGFGTWDQSLGRKQAKQEDRRVMAEITTGSAPPVGNPPEKNLQMGGPSAMKKEN